ncbi:hypothetical protein FLM48_14070 [Shewanella sp. Scap07]|uniref:hypothetical protein n=1 Tax=Shewanella sp. Scap07 TaxID=2589987 RepID=UPI0015BEE11A|nr:hypothetical protein [Shewanella sp. Scap07]QLE86093.1 hypothetical protein FLM48_14070 [Shewanella sp. Scap07]
MKAILHIGTEKTGTTTIQGYLSKNIEKFRENGILVPRTVGYPNNLIVPVLCYKEWRNDDLSSFAQNMFETNNYSIFREKVVKSLREEINNSGCSTVLFSSEHLQSRLISVEDVSVLKELLFDLGFQEIKILIYLRDPAQIGQSLFSTAIKCGAVLEQQPLPNTPYFKNVCHHKNTLIRWQSVFGKASIDVRIFDKAELYGNDLILDFLRALEIPEYFDNDVRIKDRNRSISRHGLDVLSRLNQTYGAPSNELIDFMETYFSQRPYRMSLKDYLIYVDFFIESNEWVRKHYFPEKEVLFPSKTLLNEDESENNYFDELCRLIHELTKA